MRGLAVKKVLAFVFSTVGSTIGWRLGAPVGTMTAFLLSIVGAAVGVYFAIRLSNAYTWTRSDHS